MEELIKKAAQALEENLGFNEITLTDGFGNTVHLVRYTPMPFTAAPGQYTTYLPGSQY